MRHCGGITAGVTWECQASVAMEKVVMRLVLMTQAATAMLAWSVRTVAPG